MPRRNIFGTTLDKEFKKTTTVFKESHSKRHGKGRNYDLRGNLDDYGTTAPFASRVSNMMLPKELGCLSPQTSLGGWLARKLRLLHLVDYALRAHGRGLLAVGAGFCGVSYLVLRSLLRVVQAANGDSGAGDDSHGEFFGVRAA